MTADPPDRGPDHPPTIDPAEARRRLIEQRDKLKRHMNRAVTQRDLLIAERQSVLRLYDRLTADYVGSKAPGADVEVLLVDHAAVHPLEKGPAAPGDLQPIFVAGTGRSGTTTTASLLGAHTGLVAMPGELRFHVSMRMGLPALLAGLVTCDEFLEAMRGLWYRRRDTPGGTPDAGLHRFLSPEQLEAALARFAADWDRSPAQACRDLIEAPIRAYLGDAPGVLGWIEHTPENLLTAARLGAMFPDLKMVNVARDGRDVASSMLPRAYGRNELIEGIRWWGHRMLRGHVQTGHLPADRIYNLRFERLAVSERDEQLAALLDFVGLEEDEAIRTRFEERVRPERVHQGRWRSDVDDGAVELVELTYRAALERLRRAGVPVESFLEEAQDFEDDRVESAVVQQELYELRVENALLRKDNLELGAILAAAGLLGGDTSQRAHLAELRRQLRASGGQVGRT